MNSYSNCCFCWLSFLAFYFLVFRGVGLQTLLSVNAFDFIFLCAHPSLCGDISGAFIDLLDPNQESNVIMVGLGSCSLR